MSSITGLAVALLAAASCATTNRSTSPPERSVEARADGSFEERIPGTSVSIRMLPVPPGAGAKIHLSATEMPWEAYDAYVFRLDEKDTSLPAGADAAARPSQPYITVDHAFGHAGYPVICISYLGAQGFCEWLSAKSGRKYRPPTEAEWELAARAGGATIDLAAMAWTSETSGGPKTHPVGSRPANAWGFHDLLGNVAEWCTAPDGTGVLRGGSYLDSAGADLFSWRQPNDKAWNRSDPQIPKSKWWLANGPFLGFRVVCEE